jgi:hypothetical protein
LTLNECGNPDCSICNDKRAAKQKAAIQAALDRLKEQSAKREAAIKAAKEQISEVVRKETERLLLGRYWSPTHVYATITTTAPVAEVEAVEEETIDLKEVFNDLGSILDTLNTRAFYPEKEVDGYALVRDMSFSIGRAVEKLRVLREDVKSWLPDEGEAGE